MEAILERISQHFTPAELVDFLDTEFSVLFDGGSFMDLLSDHLEDLKEEIGMMETEDDE